MNGYKINKNVFLIIEKNISIPRTLGTVELAGYLLSVATVMKKKTPTSFCCAVQNNKQSRFERLFCIHAI